MIRIINIKEGREDGFFQKLEARLAEGDMNVTRQVEDIVWDVRSRGDQALIDYTRRFDGVELDPSALRVTGDEIQRAYEKTDARLVEVIRKAAGNIEGFHRKQLENSWVSTDRDGILLGQMYRPLETVGVYVPGGTAAYPSSVLMNVIPAKVAGVGRIVMVTPPGNKSGINPAILVAANEAGADEIYRVGGAQAVASLAFGTETIPKVDKITGPGNIYVATAKKLVYGYCDIDMIAGPSEIMIVADESGNARFIAADLLSQAEHDVLASSILVTTSERLAEEVRAEIERQAALLGRESILRKSLADYGAIIIVENMEQALEIVNSTAPEHLELCVAEPFSLLDSVKNAGAVFLGHYSPEPLGDYFAGPNHVLPTGGTARFFSPLSVSDFMKKSSLISYTKKALEKVKDDVVLFAEAEGLAAHANAIRVRFEKDIENSI